MPYETPRTHFLDEMARGLGIEGELSEAIAQLSPDYMLSPYPDAGGPILYEEYTEDTARRKVLTNPMCHPSTLR